MVSTGSLDGDQLSVSSLKPLSFTSLVFLILQSTSSLPAEILPGGKDDIIYWHFIPNMSAMETPAQINNPGFNQLIFVPSSSRSVSNLSAKYSCRKEGYENSNLKHTFSDH